jgi:hypothetical protein
MGCEMGGVGCAREERLGDSKQEDKRRTSHVIQNYRLGRTNDAKSYSASAQKYPSSAPPPHFFREGFVTDNTGDADQKKSSSFKLAIAKEV